MTQRANIAPCGVALCRRCCSGPEVVRRCAVIPTTSPPSTLQEQLARGQRGVAEQVFAGTYPYHSYRPLKELVSEDKVDLPTFLYISSLVSGVAPRPGLHGPAG